MPETISIYDTEVRPLFFVFFARIVGYPTLQIRRPAKVVVNSIAPFVPRFLEKVGDPSTQKEAASRVQGRHLSLLTQPRTRAGAKKDKRKPGMTVPRLRPESWRLPGGETK